MAAINGNTHKKLTLCSLFDGSGGFCMGALLAAIKPVSCSEVEPFPIRVTTKRLPFVKHLGDINKIYGGEIEPVDIITGGFPCQSCSLAGKRHGIKHIEHGDSETTRSGLFYEAIRIIQEMRDATNGKYPKYAVFENVEGLLSSRDGEDFQIVIEEICKIKNGILSVPRPDRKWTKAGEVVGDDFSVAWRLFDSQHWGVPQRRRRLYIVADFRAQRAGKILFESEGLSGYSAESFKSWQRTTEGAKVGIGATGGIVLNDQGGQRMDVTENIMSTLRAQANHPPCIMEAAGFCPEQSAKTRGIGYEEENSPTLRAGVTPAAVIYDARGNGNGDVSSTVTGDHENRVTDYTSVVVENPKSFDVRFTSEGTRNARQNVYETKISRTIDTGGNAPDSNQGGVAVVAYGICSKGSNSMKSDNPKSGIYEAETARTLDTSNQCPAKNQGGIAVVEGNGARPSHHGDGYKESDIMYTLNTVEQHAVAYGIDRATYNMGQNAQFGIAVEEEVEPTMVAKGPGAVAHPVYHSSKNSFHTDFKDTAASDTLVATDYKDPPTVSKEPYYIVRRLTPIECARLQGMPSWWCDGLETENPDDEELAFWRKVYDDYARINGTKPKSDKQIIKWLKAPYSDSAAYKLYGNGITLSVVFFVLAGIAYWDNEP